MSSGKYHVVTPEHICCDVCLKKASKSCLTCCASFCVDHVKEHYTALALQRHKLVDSTADLQQRLCQHHNKVLDLFCQTDNIPVCALCSVEEHKGHEIILNPVDQDITQVLHMKEQEWIIREDIPLPGSIKITSVKPDSVSLSWEPPEGLTGSQRFRVSVKCSQHQRYLEVQSSKLNIHNLIPQEDYVLMVATISEEHNQSSWVSDSACTAIPPPESLDVTTTTTSIGVTWSQPAALVNQVSYLVTLKKSDEHLRTISTEALECPFSDLQPATQYTIQVVTVIKNGCKSEPAVLPCQTVIPVPENLQVDSVTATTVDLSWSLAEEMNHVPHNFEVYHNDKWNSFTELETIYTNCGSAVIRALKPHQEYNIYVCTIVENVGKSQKANIGILTGVPPVTDLRLSQSSQTHVELHWYHQERPTRYHQCHYLISYHSDGSDQESFTAEDVRASIKGLKLNKEYTVTVTAVVNDGRMSDPVSTTFRTGLPSPGPIQFTSVMPYSVSLCWGRPEGLTSLPRFKVTCSCCTNETPQERPQTSRFRRGRRRYGRTTEENIVDSPISKATLPLCMIVQCLEASFEGLVPDTQYDFDVTTLNEIGIESPRVFATTQTGIPGPVDVSINLEDLSCTWKQPPGVSGESYQLGLFRDGECIKTISTKSLTCPLSDLDFETEYTIKILTFLDSGHKSKPLSKTLYIDIPVPADLNVDSVSATSVKLSWNLSCVMKQSQHSFLISYHKEGTEPKTIPTDSPNAVITGLEPDTKYMVSVCAIFQFGRKSQLVTTIIHTDPPAPGPIQFSSVSSDSVCLCWGIPEGLTGSQRFRVTYAEKNSAKACNFVVQGHAVCVRDLTPAEEYEFSVATVHDSGKQSSSVSATICSEVPVPLDVNVDLSGKSAKVSWSKPAGLDKVSYLLTLCSNGECEKTISTGALWCQFSELQFDTEYTISVSSVLPNGRQSKPVLKKQRVV